MWRRIENDLLAWKDDPRRRVLLVRGARQVGKTFSIRQLGKTFPHFLEVNFEENKDVAAFFQGSLDPARLVEKLSAYFAVPVIPRQTLLFLDEIQACPNALASLRFFHEKMPGLHVVGAGSLLELAMEQIPSLGVGRLGSLFMHPMCFSEFLAATGGEGLARVVEPADPEHPVDAPFHARLLDVLRTYLLVGGMPAAVATYAEQRYLPTCFKVLDDLVLTLEDDFAKYRKRSPVARLVEVFRSIAGQTGGKFKFSRVGSGAPSGPLKDALMLLVRAGLAHRVVHTDARGIPLGAQTDDRKFKVLLFDLGVHQRMLGLDVPAFLAASDIDLVNKGSLAELFVGLELVANGPSHRRPGLYYWHREARASNAEVDYVVQRGSAIVPVEVKAGTRGGMQSMRIFMDERRLGSGVRVSMENFSRLERIEVLPLYAAGRLAQSPLRAPET
ncbi:MAG: ATP-binding protein [Deltaproteobacteria bacterium]|nr:ATP-binding protein [Deltaproteobacteria bacterium]